MKNVFYLYFFLIVVISSLLVNSSNNNIVVVNNKKIIPVVKEIDNSYDYYRNLYSNKDIIGSIRIDNYFDVLFVKTTDNSFYLNHNLSKEYDILGSVFLDYRTNFPDKKILIYGHNFKYNKTAFGELEKYLDYSFYKDNKFIIIDTDLYEIKYEIFSVYLTKDDYEYFDVDIFDYEKHYNNLINNSLYNTNVTINKLDNILVLQTCSDKYKDYFVIVCAKEIEKRKK